MILNLDTNFNPFPKKKEITFESFTFSGGEPHIKIKDDLLNEKEVMITHRINSFNDFGLLLIAIDALKRMSIEKINVFIPYFPAARQDRLMIKGESLTVKVYADIINKLQLQKVTIYDPHSEVTDAVVNKSEIINNHTFIKKITQQLKTNLLLVSPDGGALKKIYKVAAYLKDYEVIECSKSRNVKTGKIKYFKVYASDLQGKDCLIVDDICDGGGTFIGLAKELKKKNAGNLYLAVSHGIFSKGFKELNTYFEQIFTTNSFKDITNKNVVQIKLKDIL